MPDGFSMSMLTKPTIDAMGDMAKRTDRATMWALRETGRKIKQEARRQAPVYKGKAGRVNLKHSQFRKFQKASGYKGAISNNVVISGLLKNSISSSKRFGRAPGGAYVIKVGPRGQRTHLYAAKIEANTKAYMRPAYDRVTPMMTGIHAAAWAKAMARK
jgi:hypothetical protein